jgi:hypothetical protein
MRSLARVEHLPGAFPAVSQQLPSIDPYRLGHALRNPIVAGALECIIRTPAMGKENR